jgi:hypothetical protein
MRGMLGGQAPQQPRMGLAGMRAPSTSSKPLTMPGAPLVKPIKAPLGASAAPSLVQPVQPRVVRKPLQPINALVQPSSSPQLDDVPLPASEAEAVPSLEEVEAAVAEEIQPLEESVEAAPAMEEASDSEAEDTAVLRPVTTVLSPASTPAVVATTTLKQVLPQLVPKKERGAPPNIKRGKASKASEEAETATLTPVRRLTPLNVKSDKPDVEKDDDDEA